MTIALLIALVVVNIAYLFLLDRRDKRAHEDHQAHRLEIAGLCQRVQAPELAVAAHNQQQYEQGPRVGASDFGMPLSDEEIAENMETIRRMERDLNESLAVSDQPWDGKP